METLLSLLTATSSSNRLTYKKCGVFSLLLLINLVSGELYSQTDFTPNYDEDKVPNYTLPDPLITEKGQAVDSQEQWWQKRRPQIARLFEKQVYGKPPEQTLELRFDVLSINEQALDGKATRKEIRVFFTSEDVRPYMDILLFVPNEATQPVPAFLGLNFVGNHAVSSDPSITLSDQWMLNRKGTGVVDHKATEASRGVRAKAWPAEMIIERGYALATVYCGDIDPDYNNFQDGVHPLFYEAEQSEPADDAWGTIGAWAWGLSRALDYLETEDAVADDQVAIIGHSRLGKAALWAGAQDQRFGMVISNNSGCGGAALFRRAYGETVEAINNACPHWFCDNFKQYNKNEESLPVDQHMLLALIAPRPVYVASAEGDQWADPKGEFLSAVHATPVYKLLGKEGLPVTEMPDVDHPIMGTIGYHIRHGKHEINDYDWQQYLNFADKHFQNRASPPHTSGN